MKRIRYVEGRPCSSCGRTKRLASNRRCVFCLFWDACRVVEGEIILSRRETARAWNTYMELGRDYRHRETARRGANIRRGRMAQAAGSFTSAQAAAILKLQNGRCAYCDATVNLHLDHAIPLARGGSNWPWNLQWLCAHHNISKGARTDAEYRDIIGLPADEPVSLQIWREFFRVSLVPILG